ncbi:MAG: hypothetical protein EOM58_06610 [Clostridia bacterium]|nr:hypothetical protein [Clostridia bacterium]
MQPHEPIDASSPIPLSVLCKLFKDDLMSCFAVRLENNKKPSFYNMMILYPNSAECQAKKAELPELQRPDSQEWNVAALLLECILYPFPRAPPPSLLEKNG